MFKRKKNLFDRIVCSFISFTFMFSMVVPPAQAQVVLNLPVPGAMVGMTNGFTPPMIYGITIHPENPLMFDFIVGRGDEYITDAELTQESDKLIKYFLASLTTPEDELWVNLSPYEKDRIIPQGFSETTMGRDLLAQDYMLKQLTASLMYPEEELGNEFWSRVYKKAYELYGTTEIPMNTFNKVWIVPQDAVVMEKDGSAYVVDSHLKVMLEEDYLALQANMGNDKFSLDAVHNDDAQVVSGITSEVVKEVLIPEIEREVNEGETFANLRQIYNSVILATWYKMNLKESLLGQVYVDQNKTKGVDVEDKQIKQKIYDQYLEAFSKGVYNYIREDIDEVTHEMIPRKYFSGGAGLQVSPLLENNVIDLDTGENLHLLTPFRKTKLARAISDAISAQAMLFENTDEKALEQAKTGNKQLDIQTTDEDTPWLEGEIDDAGVVDYETASSPVVADKSTFVDIQLGAQSGLEDLEFVRLANFTAAGRTFRLQIDRETNELKFGVFRGQEDDLYWPKGENLLWLGMGYEFSEVITASAGLPGARGLFEVVVEKTGTPDVYSFDIRTFDDSVRVRARRPAAVASSAIRSASIEVRNHGLTVSAVSTGEPLYYSVSIMEEGTKEIHKGTYVVSDFNIDDAQSLVEAIGQAIEAEYGSRNIVTIVRDVIYGPRKTAIQVGSSPVGVSLLKNRGLPQKLKDVKYPHPQEVVRDKNGNMYARWAMLFGLVDMLLEWDRLGKMPKKLDRKLSIEVEQYMSHAYGLDNLGDTDTGIRVKDQFEYLEELGLIGKDGQGRYFIKEKKEILVTWARLNTHIERDLSEQFDEFGDIKDEQELLKFIKKYEQAAQEINPINLVEPYQPFLRAVLGISADKRKSLVEMLQRTYFEGEDASYTGGIMVDSILLMLRGVKDLKKWAKVVYPNLRTEGRKIYMAAPEITLLSGGLGRVMQYLGRALKHMGMDVEFIEPSYPRKKNKTTQQEEPLDYEALPIPLSVPEETTKEFDIWVQGATEHTLVYRTVNDEGIPVNVFKDEKGHYIQVLYLYDQDGHPSAFEVTEFGSKAIPKMVELLEEDRKKELGDKWVPPVIASNDGQTLMTSAWRLFNPDYQSDTLLETFYMGTGHTVRNRIMGNDHDFWVRAGIPADWLWLLKRKMPEGDGRGELYDATSGGLRALQWFGGFANAVSGVHGADIGRFDPQIGGPIHGLTNGDLISLTMREFGLAFLQTDYVTDAVKFHVEELQTEIAEAGKFEKAEKQREIDEFLYEQVWGFVDDAQNTDDDIKAMFKEVQNKVKRKYIEEYIKPNMGELGIKIPDQYNGNEEQYWEDVIQMPWIGYSGRWVSEKDGRKRAFHDDILKNATIDTETPAYFVIAGNPQFYPGTENRPGSVWSANETLSVARDINGENAKGKVVFKKGFELDEQLLLLMALDTQMQDSDMEEEHKRPIGSGAAESTEAHTWMHGGTSTLHGFIQLIAPLMNRMEGRGSNPNPKDERPESYLEVYDWLGEAKKDGSLDDHLVDGFKMFRAIDVILTAAAYARGWENAIVDEQKHRTELMRKHRLSLADSLKAEYALYAREEREVSIAEVKVENVSNRSLTLPLNSEWHNGRQSFYRAPSKQGEKVRVLVQIDPNEIQREHIGVWLRDKGVVHEMKFLRQEGSGMLTYSTELERKSLSDRQLEVVASAGLWEEIRDIRLTSKISTQERDFIRNESGQNFNVEAVRPKADEQGVVQAESGDTLEFKIDVPFDRSDLAEHVKLVVFGNTNTASSNQWDFFKEGEYCMGNCQWQNGRLHGEVEVRPKRTGQFTFGMADADRGVTSVEDVIAWKGREGENITVKIFSPGRSNVPRGRRSSSPIQDALDNGKVRFKETSLFDAATLTSYLERDEDGIERTVHILFAATGKREWTFTEDGNKVDDLPNDILQRQRAESESQQTSSPIAGSYSELRNRTEVVLDRLDQSDILSLGPNELLKEFKEVRKTDQLISAVADIRNYLTTYGVITEYQSTIRRLEYELGLLKIDESVATSSPVVTGSLEDYLEELSVNSFEAAKTIMRNIDYFSLTQDFSPEDSRAVAYFIVDIAGEEEYRETFTDEEVMKQVLVKNDFREELASVAAQAVVYRGENSLSSSPVVTGSLEDYLEELSVNSFEAAKTIMRNIDYFSLTQDFSPEDSRAVAYFIVDIAGEEEYEQAFADEEVMKQVLVKNGFREELASVSAQAVVHKGKNTLSSSPLKEKEQLDFIDGFNDDIVSRSNIRKLADALTRSDKVMIIDEELLLFTPDTFENKRGRIQVGISDRSTENLNEVKQEITVTKANFYEMIGQAYGRDKDDVRASVSELLDEFNNLSSSPVTFEEATSWKREVLATLNLNGIFPSTSETEFYNHDFDEKIVQVVSFLRYFINNEIENITKVGGLVPTFLDQVKQSTDEMAQRVGLDETGPLETRQQVSSTPIGGIDLNPAMMDLQIKRDGNGIPLPVFDQPIHTMKIDGFLPVIINVAPVTNLPMLLGLIDTDDDDLAKTFNLDPFDQRIARFEYDRV